MSADGHLLDFGERSSALVPVALFTTSAVTTGTVSEFAVGRNRWHVALTQRFVPAAHPVGFGQPGRFELHLGGTEHGERSVVEVRHLDALHHHDGASVAVELSSLIAPKGGFDLSVGSIANPDEAFLQRVAAGLADEVFQIADLEQNADDVDESVLGLLLQVGDVDERELVCRDGAVVRHLLHLRVPIERYLVLVLEGAVALVGEFYATPPDKIDLTDLYGVVPLLGRFAEEGASNLAAHGIEQVDAEQRARTASSVEGLEIGSRGDACFDRPAALVRMETFDGDHAFRQAGSGR